MRKNEKVFAFVLLINLFVATLSGQINPEVMHSVDSINEEISFHCPLEGIASQQMLEGRNKRIIERFGSIENWSKMTGMYGVAQRSATCDLKTEIVLTGNATPISTTVFDAYAQELSGTGGEFTHPTNVVLVANSVVVPDLATIFPTAISFNPAAGVSGEYEIDMLAAAYDDLPLFGGFASNITNQTIIKIPLTYDGPDGLKPIRINCGGVIAGACNPLGSTDGSYPVLDTDKSNLSHGFMLATATPPAGVLIHELGHGLGLVHNLITNPVNYMFQATSATRFTDADRATGSISLQMAGPEGTNGTNGYGFFDTQCTSVPVPVELLHFTVSKLDDFNDLEWATASEHECRGFYIERSSDAHSWEQIGWVDGGGNSVFYRQYLWKDINPLKEQSYYRLIQMDMDGKFTYSSIQSVLRENAETISLYPNPVSSNSFFIECNKPIKDTVILNITDMYGRVLWHENKTMDGKMNNLEVGVSFLSAGEYILNIEGAKTNQKLLFIKI